MPLSPAAIPVVPALHDVGLDGHDLRAAGGRKGAAPADEIVGVVPGISGAGIFGAELEPGRAAIGGRPETGARLRAAR